MSSIREQVTQNVKDAMRAKDKARLSVLRMLQAAFKQVEVDERRELSDEDVMSILTKQIKQRKESFKQYSEAGRDDLAATEQAEIDVLSDYLPSALTAGELENLISEAISELNAEGMKAMGQVMNWLRPKVQGRTDMGALSGAVKAKLMG